jgi:hypothetical protein
MQGLIAAAFDLQCFCEKRNWKFCFIGGLAVQALAEPRLTNDTDMTLLTGFGGEEPFVDALLKRYRPRRPDAKEFSLTHRVLLLLADNGSGMDIALGALPFEERVIERARYETYSGGIRLRICSPEDLIVMKAFASREQDWLDVRMTMVRRGVDTLDWNYITEQLTPLAEAKEDPGILERLEELKRRCSLG